MTNRYWLERPFLIGHPNEKGIIKGKKLRNQGKLQGKQDWSLIFEKQTHLCYIDVRTINQYKIKRLYCLLLICIKTSIFFCVLKYLEVEHAFRTEHISSQHVCRVEHAFSDRQHTNRVRAATRQVCCVKISQHAKRVNFQHALLSPISTRQFGVRVLKTWCVLS